MCEVGSEKEEERSAVLQGVVERPSSRCYDDVTTVNVGTRVLNHVLNALTVDDHEWVA